MAKKKPALIDYPSTALQIVYLLISMVYIVVYQYIWKVTAKMGDEKEKDTLIKRTSSQINRKMSMSLAEGIPDEDDDEETVEEKTKKCLAVVNGAAAVHSAISKFYLRFNPFWKRVVEFETSPKDLAKKTYIYMGNHTSFGDFIFLAGFGVNVTAVGRGDLLKLPVGGRILKNSGYLPVHFKKKPNGKWGTDIEKTKQMLRDAVDYLRYGVSILVFPEGQITLGENFSEFKDGFFKVAKTAQVDIVPFAIWGCEDAWPMSNKSVPRSTMGTGTVCIKIGSPMKRFTAERCAMFTSDGDMLEYLQKEYDVDFTDERELGKIPEIAEQLIGHIINEEVETEEFHKLTAELFKLTVRKKIFQMRCEMQEKHAKLTGCVITAVERLMVQANQRVLS